MRASLARGATAKGHDHAEHQRERGERVPLQRVALVALDAKVGWGPVAREAVVRGRMLLDDERRELEPGLGREGGDVQVLAQRAIARRARFQGARQALERYADDALLAARRAHFGWRMLNRRKPA